MTAAERTCALLRAVAAAFAALGGVSGHVPVVVATAAALLAGVGAAGYFWTLSSRRGPTVLQRDREGRLWLWSGDAVPVPATLGPGSRILGPTLYLEVNGTGSGSLRGRHAWLTPLDVPADRLRRWTVVLPGSGAEGRP